MKKGFTMIELIFVIVILGILASVAIPRLASTRSDAEISAAIANMRTMLSDVATYYVTTGRISGDVKQMTSVNLTNIQTGEDINEAETAQGVGAKIGAKGSIPVAGDNNCIEFEFNSAYGVYNDGDNCPATIQFNKGTSTNAVCQEVQNAPAVKEFLEAKVSCAGTNRFGYNPQKNGFAIGSSTSVY